MSGLEEPDRLARGEEAAERVLLGATLDDPPPAFARLMRRVNSSSEYEYSGSGSYRRVSPASASEPAAVSINSPGISARKREGSDPVSRSDPYILRYTARVSVNVSLARVIPT